MVTGRICIELYAVYTRSTREHRLLSLISREYPDLLYTIEDVRNIKDGVRIFYKDPKRRILGFFGM